jgi:hypothetical protein
MFGIRSLLLILLSAGLFLGLSLRIGAADDQPAFGPLYQEFKLTLTDGERTEGVGPFYYSEREKAEWEDVTETWAVPPIFSYLRNDSIDYQKFDFLWKLATYDRYGDEYRFQLAQWFSFAGGGTQSATNVHRFTLFPIYFQQRSAVPEKNYTALFPIYGTIKERFFRDEIKFVLFPLFGQTRKRGVTTDNYLYPVLHVRHGNGVHGWQVWPLTGNERLEPTTRTNVWGEPELAGGFHKFFALWPIFSLNRSGQGTTNQTLQHSVLPFYTSLRSPLRDSITAPWPLGVTHTIDREKKYDEWGAPWPLIVFTRGEGKTENRVFPFFSEAHSPALTGRWYLWPVYKYNRLHSAPLDRARTRICFFIYSDTVVKNTETARTKRQIDLLPLFTWHREFEGSSRLQVLAPLEPFLPNNSGVERNLSPLWSVWRAEKNPGTGAASQSLLWNLYRHDATQQTKKFSLLFGLFRYQSGPEGKSCRLFYIPMGKARKPAEAVKP